MCYELDTQRATLTYLQAFTSSFISYWLIKWLPLWGLALIFNTFVFLGPLIYLKNQEFIDAHLNHAKELASAQATQVRDMAAQHTGRALSRSRATPASTPRRHKR